MKFFGRKGALPTFCETLKGVSTKIFQAPFSFVNGPPQTQTLDPPLITKGRKEQKQVVIKHEAKIDTTVRYFAMENGCK